MFNKQEFTEDTNRMLESLQKLIKQAPTQKEKERLQEVFKKTSEWQKELL